MLWECWKPTACLPEIYYPARATFADALSGSFFPKKKKWMPENLGKLVKVLDTLRTRVTPEEVVY
jgi:hypothetical protein